MAGFLPKDVLQIVHMSDVHLSQTRGMISTPLWRRACDLLITPHAAAAAPRSLFVFTGDIAKDSPDEDLYRAVQQELGQRIAVDEHGRGRVVILPGNHDRRMLGNVMPNHSAFEAVFPDWKQPWWHPYAALIVIPLDSNPVGNIPGALTLARGRVERAELDRIGSGIASVRSAARAHLAAQLTMLDDYKLARLAFRHQAAFDYAAITALRPAAFGGGTLDVGFAAGVRNRLADVLTDTFVARAVRCVALHHHPIGIVDTENLGFTHQDVYLALTNSGEFLYECRRHGINLVLHGHKHMPHRTLLALPNSEHEPIGIVGCGSTTVQSEFSDTSANRIAITPTGEASVELVRMTATEVNANGQKLAVRTWPQVKRELANVARKHGSFSAEHLNIFIEVMESGDAVITRNYRGVRFKEKDADEMVRFPIDALGGGNGMLQGVTIYATNSEQQVRVSQPDHELAAADPSNFHGCITARIAGTDEVLVDITVRFIAFAAFATNSWQCVIANGKANTPEGYSWTNSQLVTKRMTAVISSTHHVFDNVTAIARNCDDATDTRELDSFRVYRSPTNAEAYIQVEEPVWGSRYGIDWTFKSASAVPSTPTSVGTALEKIDKVKAALVNAAINPQLEVCVFKLADGRGKAMELHPVAWTARVEECDLHKNSFRVGVGVAGRAAWLAQTVEWATAGDDYEDDDEMLDFYAPASGDITHTAVLAVPLISRGRFHGVLSVASQTEDDFAAAIRRRLAAAAPRATGAAPLDATAADASLKWVAELAAALIA